MYIYYCTVYTAAFIHRTSYVHIGTTVVTHICIYSSADDIYLCVVCTTTTYLEQSMDQLRKLPKLARGQLNREIKCPCRCTSGKFICFAVYIRYMYIRARLTVCYLNKQS